MTEQTEKTEITLKTDSAFFRLIKTHGLSIALLVCGLYVRNKDLEEIKLHNAKMESMLFDCYEKRIKSKEQHIGNSKDSDRSNNTPQISRLFTVPTKKRNGYEYSIV